MAVTAAVAALVSTAITIPLVDNLSLADTEQADGLRLCFEMAQDHVPERQ